MAGVKDSRTSRRPKSYHQNDRGGGMAVPVPTSGGPVKRYQTPILEGNGPRPPHAYNGNTGHTKPLPGKPSNLA